MLYLSEKTGKSYKTVKELEADEKELAERESEEKKKSEEKKARAQEVADAYKEYEDLKAKFAKQLDEAYKHWVSLREKFADDYGGYHMTYVRHNDEEPEITFGDFVSKLLNW